MQRGVNESERRITMGLIQRFSSFLGTVKSSTTMGTTFKSVVSNLAAYIIELSKFFEMKDEDVYEQLYVWEPEIGGAIDRISTLVRQAYRGFSIKDYDNVQSPDEEEMLAQAEIIADSIDIASVIETYAEVLQIHGNLILMHNKDFSDTILPNKYCAFIEEKEQFSSMTQQLIMNPKYLAFNERSNIEVEKTLIPIDKISHVRLKDTPVFVKDTMGRQTFGIYAISPLQRTVLSVWWKRQSMIVDVLVRWKNVPKEVHTINSNLFSLNNYKGTIPDRAVASRNDTETFIKSYASNLKNANPDTAYIIPDTASISILEPRVNYIESNDLVGQLVMNEMAALNVPMSIVNGQNAGSYASELVISNYVSAKVIQIGNKLKPVILSNIRKRLLAIKSTYPVDKLDIKFELKLANSELESFRKLAIMEASSVFTDNELRKSVDYPDMTPEQLAEIQEKRANKIKTSGAYDKTTEDVKRDVLIQDNTKSADYKDTPQQDESHNRDESDNILR